MVTDRELKGNFNRSEFERNMRPGLKPGPPKRVRKKVGTSSLHRGLEIFGSRMVLEGLGKKHKPRPQDNRKRKNVGVTSQKFAISNKYKSFRRTKAVVPSKKGFIVGGRLYRGTTARIVVTRIRATEREDLIKCRSGWVTSGQRRADNL